jgi:hypothetical protein
MVIPLAHQHMSTPSLRFGMTKEAHYPITPLALILFGLKLVALPR